MQNVYGDVTHTATAPGTGGSWGGTSDPDLFASSGGGQYGVPDAYATSAYVPSTSAYAPSTSAYDPSAMSGQGGDTAGEWNVASLYDSDDEENPDDESVL